MREFLITDEQARKLPIDLLALEILQDAIENNEWNSRNWMLSAKQGTVSYSQAGLDAFCEAWEWLHNNGLVMEDRFDQSGLHSIKVTRLGRAVAQSGDLARLRASARLNVDLHPALESKVRPQFLMGDYEMAAFAAMKAVEVHVREMAGLPASAIGVKLMRTAFGPGGRLCDTSLDEGEQSARRELFSGAIGTIKNPTSHREVQYDDPTEASEAVLLADLLMRILDRIPNESPE